MSVTTCFFIEVRDKTTGKWNRLTHYIPSEERTKVVYDRVHGKEMTIATKPDIDNPPLEENKIELVYQGFVRDMFNRTLSTDNRFVDRGFPVDISEGSKEYFEECERKLQTEKAEYVRIHGEEPHWFTKEYWGESYATLAELDDYLNTRHEDWVKSVKSTCQNLYGNVILMKKMDELMKSMNVQSKYSSNDEEEYSTEDLNYYMFDVFWDLAQLSGFINCVENLVEAVYPHGYFNYEDIRVISYSC